MPDKTWIMRKFRKFRTIVHSYILTRDLNFHRRMEWDIISNWLQAGTNEAILDVGCANGFYTQKLARRRCKALGVELDKDAIRLAQRRGSTRGIEFLVGDAQNLTIKNESLDKIILVSVLEHIPKDEYALKEIARVLKADGCLVMSLDSLSHKTTSNLTRERHRKRHHVKTFYTIPSIDKKLKKNGLQLERGKYILSSRLSNMFLRLRHAHITFLIAYPLSKVFDRFSGLEEGGAMLIVKAGKKCNDHKRDNNLHSRKRSAPQLENIMNRFSEKGKTKRF